MTKWKKMLDSFPRAEVLRYISKFYTKSYTDIKSEIIYEIEDNMIWRAGLGERLSSNNHYIPEDMIKAVKEKLKELGYKVKISKPIIDHDDTSFRVTVEW